MLVRLSRIGFPIVALLGFCATFAAAQSVNVTTFHGDAMRTGWNAQETALTPATVGGSAFRLLASATLDDQVDAQPLVVGNVVYVATAGDTVYALDGGSGAVLSSRNFGTPVPQSSLPGQCSNNGPNVGIDSTPVIDLSNNVMYVMVYTYESQQPVFRIHELSLSTLADVVSPVTVAASHRLTGGLMYHFQPRYSRQRSALLEANGAIYAGFSSYCDFASNVSRGWVLGWQTGSLAPLPANHLDDRLGRKQDSFFLSSVWMSGSGVAADTTGNLFYATGNSEPGSYDGTYNIQESVVKESAALTNLLGIFTPYDVVTLDDNDEDFGSGGVLVLPDQAGPLPHLALAAGKDGRMFLLDRDRLGGYTAGGPDHVVGQVNIGGCWCGESYFVPADGITRIVSSGGSDVNVWKLVTSPNDQLVLESTSQTLINGQDGGFLNSVSSNGSTASTAVIWAVGRPTSSNPGTVHLYAFNAADSTTLFTAAAGVWPNVSGNANIVPVVANGKVYVGSYRTLTIFGLSGTASRTHRSTR